MLQVLKTGVQFHISLQMFHIVVLNCTMKYMQFLRQRVKLLSSVANSCVFVRIFPVFPKSFFFLFKGGTKHNKTKLYKDISNTELSFLNLEDPFKSSSIYEDLNCIIFLNFKINFHV